MCNAWNHPPNCTCGWGGVGHLGRRAESNNSYADRGSSEHTYIYPQGIPPIQYSVESFTIPNARCPVCKTVVFYYCNNNGSSVFFDELGPPWPKHPCTDTTKCGTIQHSNLASHLPETVGNPTPKKISQSYSSEDLDEPLHENIGWYPVKISSCSFWKDGISYLTGIKLSNQELFTLYYKGRTISRILFCYCLDLEEGKRKLDLITHDGWRYIVDSFCHKSDVSPKNGILENYFHVNLKPKVDMNMGIKEKPKRNGYLRMEKIHNNIDINVKYNDRHSNKPKRK